MPWRPPGGGTPSSRRRPRRLGLCVPPWRKAFPLLTLGSRTPPGFFLAVEMWLSDLDVDMFRARDATAVVGVALWATPFPRFACLTLPPPGGGLSSPAVTRREALCCRSIGR